MIRDGEKRKKNIDFIGRGNVGWYFKCEIVFLWFGLVDFGLRRIYLLFLFGRVAIYFYFICSNKERG